MKRSTVLQLLLAIIAISFAALFFKNASSTHPLAAAGIRLAIAGLILSPFTALTLYREAREFMLTGMMCGVFYAVHFGAWVWSLNLTSVAVSVTLVTATPLILAFIGLATGQDRPQRKLWLSIFTGTCGIVIIGFAGANTTHNHWSGVLLALLGCVGMAFYMLTVRRLGRFDIWPFMTVSTLVGATILLATCASLDIPIWPAESRDLIWLCLAAAIPQLVGHTFLTRALREATPTQVGLATIGEPIGATLIAWCAFDEQPGILVIFGCIVTLSALVVAVATLNADVAQINKGKERT